MLIEGGIKMVFEVIVDNSVVCGRTHEICSKINNSD